MPDAIFSRPASTASRPPTPGGGKSTGQIVRDSNRWRDQYNPLRSLVLTKVVAMLEAAERGDYAELQLTMRKLEKRYPVLKGLKARIHAAIEKLDWDIKIVEPLPEGATEAQAEAQRVHLRSRYDLIENLTEAVGFLATAEFRGYAILQKHRFNDSARHDGAVRELHWLPQDQFSRAGCFGDFFYNKDSTFGIGGDGCAAALGEANRIGGAQLPRDEFVIREEESPLYEIALIAFVNWAMGRKDWAAFTEIFGLPKGVVIMPANIPSGKEAEYQSAAEKVSDGVAGALPADSDIKFPTSNFRNNGPFKEYCDAQDADVVLAGTGGRLAMLTADKGGLGSGPSEEHADAFGEIAQAIARRINQTLQRDFDRPELAAEFPGQPVLAYFELCAVEEEDATEVIGHIVALAGAGYRVHPEQIQEKTGYQLDPNAASAPGPEVDPVLRRQIEYAKWKRAFESGETNDPAPQGGEDGLVQNREDEDGRWVTINGRPVFIRDGESADEAADRAFSDEKKVKKSSTETSKTAKLNEQDERTDERTDERRERRSERRSQGDGGRVQSRQGQATSAVLDRVRGPDPEDADSANAQRAAQSAELEKLYASGEATIQSNSARVKGEGGEHIVELSEDGTRVIKHTKGSFGYALRGQDAPLGSFAALDDATPQEYRQRIDLHNQVFGDDTRIEGVSKAWNDNVGLVVSQRVIKGRSATAEEAAAYLKKHGFVQVRNEALFGEHLEKHSTTWFHPKSGIVATDVKPDNFKVTPAGKIHSIDTIVQRVKPGSALERAMLYGTRAAGRLRNRAPDSADTFAQAIQAKLDPVAALLNRIVEIKDDAQMQSALQVFLGHAEHLAALVTADVAKQAAALEALTAPAFADGLAGKQP